MKVILLALGLVFSVGNFSYAGEESFSIEKRIKTFSDIQKIFKSEKNIKKMSEFVKTLDAKATPDEILQKLIKFLEGIIGEKAAKILLELMGVPDFREHVLLFIDHVRMVQDAENCEEGLSKSVSDISWIASYALLTYYVRIPVAPSIGAKIISEAVLLIMDRSTISVRICDQIHG